jgi:cytochrome b561
MTGAPAINRRSPASKNGNQMDSARSIARYSAMTQTIHWVTALLVLVAFVYGLGGPELHVYAPARDFDRQLHETLGLSVLALVALRVIWRTIDRRPDPPQVARWMGVAAKVVQGALYALLVAVPLTAVAGAWLEGHPLTLLAGVQIAPMLAQSHDTGATIATIHTWLGDAILWVAGLHAVAGIYHHLVLGDTVLASMLPRWLPVAGRRRP